MANYAFTTGKSLPSIENGHTFENCNFNQVAPHTVIFAGTTGLTFRGCNLINCDIPADAVKIDCNGGHIEYCGRVHPKWTDKGVANCSENCAHVAGTDEIQVAGVRQAIVYHHLDKVVV